MRIRIVVLAGFALLMGRAAVGQEYPKLEVPIDYSYARGNPANVGKPFSLNGGGGGIVFNFNSLIGFKMDLQGYASTTTTINNVLIVGPGGTSLGTVQATGNLFTYMFGPQFRFPTHTI